MFGLINWLNKKYVYSPFSLFDCDFDRTAREFHYNDIQRERERVGINATSRPREKTRYHWPGERPERKKEGEMKRAKEKITDADFPVVSTYQVHSASAESRKVKTK